MAEEKAWKFGILLDKFPILEYPQEDSHGLVPILGHALIGLITLAHLGKITHTMNMMLQMDIGPSCMIIPVT